MRDTDSVHRRRPRLLQPERSARLARLAISIVGALAGCGGGEAEPVWTQASQSIDVGCFNFFSGSMRFSATRDQLSADQPALLSGLRTIEAVPGCTADVTECQIAVTDQAGQQSTFAANQTDSACSTPGKIVSFQSLEPFLQTLGCQYAKNLTYGPASPVAADARCFNGLFTSGGGSIAVTLTVDDAQVARHIELDDCDQPGRLGKLAFTVFDSDGTTALGTATAVPDAGPNHTCTALDVAFPRAGQFPLDVVADPSIMPAGDFYLRFY